MRKERDEAETISLVDGAIARMRDLAHDLRPPMLDELGLAASLRWYVEREARRVDVELRAAGGELELVVRDDGRGFDVGGARRCAMRGKSQGLLSMQERVALAGGKLEIDSALGQGTAVRARLPLGGAR